MLSDTQISRLLDVANAACHRGNVLDVLDEPRALQGIRDEVLEMDLAVKRHMDTGLAPDEWAVAQAVREATQAALHAMDNMVK